MAETLPTRSVKAECQIVVFKWRNEAVPGFSNTGLAQSIPHDISRYISNVSFQKTKDAAAGQFEIILENDRDWKEYISKGEWLIIYLSNDGGLTIPDKSKRNTKSLGNGLMGDKVDVLKLTQQKDRIRCIGCVDTVRTRGTTGQEKGEFDVTYVVSGRDFGIVYEEAEVWHNQFQYDKTLLNRIDAQIAQQSIKNVDKLLEVLHHLFLNPSKFVQGQELKNDSFTSLANQWLLPNLLWRALGFRPKGSTYFGKIPGLFNFGRTPASYPVEKPSSLIDGIMWNRLKSHSIEPYHELFTELNDNGEPQLIFRLMPWVVDTRSVKNFPDIAKAAGNKLFFARPENGIVELENINLMNWDIGEDNHSRYNLFWSTIATAMVSTDTSNTLVDSNDPKTGFPRINQESIKRYGLRMLYSEVNANIIFGTERADPKLIKQFNEYALEMWERSHEYESGTQEIIGNNEVRLGKCVHFADDCPYNSDKYFYIEGYDEMFTVNENGSTEWTQNLFLTRGIEAAVLKNARLVKRRQTPFSNSGDFTDK